LKPFVGNPAGNQSRPAESGQQPEASLAWGRATVTANRSEIKRRAIEPRNLLAVSPRLCMTRGPCYAVLHLIPQELPDPAGVEEQGE
jgi:hypothetical protein